MAARPALFLSELKLVLFHAADEQGQLIDQHGQPADAVAHGHDLQIDLALKNCRFPRRLWSADILACSTNIAIAAACSARCSPLQR